MKRFLAFTLFAASAWAQITCIPACTSSNGIGPVTVTGTPSAGMVPTAISSTAATWQTPSGGGGLVLVEAHTASTSANLPFTTCLSSTYSEYYVTFENLVPASNTVQIYLRVSTNGGSTWDSTSIYDWAAWRFSNNGSTAKGAVTDAQFSLTASDTMPNTASPGGLAGTLNIHSVGSGQYTRFSGIFSYNSGGSPDMGGLVFSAAYSSTSTINAFEVFASSGNISSGTVRCYGVQH